MCRKQSGVSNKNFYRMRINLQENENLTYQCSCSSLDYELSDQSLRLFGVPSEFVTQQTSESRGRGGVKYTASLVENGTR